MHVRQTFALGQIAVIILQHQQFRTPNVSLQNVLETVQMENINKAVGTRLLVNVQHAVEIDKLSSFRMGASLIFVHLLSVRFPNVASVNTISVVI